MAELGRSAVAAGAGGCIGGRVLNDLLAVISVKESLLPSRNLRCPAEVFLERTYLPSLERSLWGW